MHGDYNYFLKQKQPSIVEIFNGYRPPTSTASTPAALDPTSTVQTVAQAGGRSLQLIPSRFDFSYNLLGAVRPDPRTLARFLSANFQHKDFITPFQVRSATVQHRRHGGVNGRGISTSLSITTSDPMSFPAIFTMASNTLASGSMEQSFVPF